MVPIKYQETYFFKLISKFIWKYNRPIVTEIILKTKNIDGELILSDFKFT